MAHAYFNSIEIFVQVDGDGRMPFPIPDENGLETYTATVLLDNGTDHTNLKNLHSKVTVIPGMGGGGTLIVERGAGFKHLVIPKGNSNTEERFACLVGFEAAAFHFKNEGRSINMTWILGDLVT